MVTLHRRLPCSDEDLQPVSVMEKILPGLTPEFLASGEALSHIAMAMESRGFQNDAPRAVAFRVRFGWVDIAFLIGLPAAILIGLWLL